jgi:hypothetical protein
VDDTIIINADVVSKQAHIIQGNSIHNSTHSIFTHGSNNEALIGNNSDIILKTDMSSENKAIFKATTHFNNNVHFDTNILANVDMDTSSNLCFYNSNAKNCISMDELNEAHSFDVPMIRRDADLLTKACINSTVLGNADHIISADSNNNKHVINTGGIAVNEITCVDYNFTNSVLNNWFANTL